MTLAIVGSVLGVINSSIQWRDRRLRLRLKLFGVGAGTFGGRCSDTELINGCNTALEIVNLSKFPVTVCEVGFATGRSGGSRTEVVSTIPSGESWPRKLEPRDSITIEIRAENWITHENLAEAQAVYAKTSCGTVRYSHNAIVDRLRAVGEQRKSLTTRIAGD